MLRFSIQVLFSCLLMLSQVALVSHDVQHLGSAHTEFCAVYASQDHSACSPGVDVAANFHVLPASLKIEAVGAFSHVSIPLYDSRAPPSIIFFS